jgi:Flp pilus assembly protein TadG
METRRQESERGQALVEFSLSIIIFLVMLMGVVDFGRAIYQYNGVSQAAREIARVTSVHPGTNFTTSAGRSAETKAVIATQQALVPDLQVKSVTCTSITGAVISAGCLPGDYVKVGVIARYTPITPLLGLIGTWELFSSSTSAQLQ